jgi:hypothetical protein
MHVRHSTCGLVGLPSDDPLADASLAISVGIRFPLLSGIRTCPSPGPAYGSDKRDGLDVDKSNHSGGRTAGQSSCGV